MATIVAAFVATITPAATTINTKEENVKMERNEIIRQMMPIPETLTPLICFHDDDGKDYYGDAISSGWSVFYVLVDDDYGGDIRFYIVDPEGSASCAEYGDVRLVANIRCPDCGQRMIPLMRHPGEGAEYRCICGNRIAGRSITALADL